MFLDEARLAALLDHPNIVRIVEVGHDGEDYFLVMELVQGKPLSAVLRKAAREQPTAQPGADGVPDRAGGQRPRIRAHVDRRRRAAARRRPPRRLAAERAHLLRGRGQDDRLRRRARVRACRPHQPRRPQGEDRLHVARAGVGGGGRSPRRRLRAGRRAVGGADRAAAVPARDRAGDDARDRRRSDSRIRRRWRPPSRSSSTRSSCARCASARTRVTRPRTRWPSRWRSSRSRTPASARCRRRRYTKSLFAAEYLQWRKTATAALDLEVEKPRASAHRPGLNAEPPTAGPTMGLRPGVAWSDGRSEARSAVGRSRSRSGQSQGQGQARSGSSHSRPPSVDGQPIPTAPNVAPKRDRTWLYAVVGVLLAIGGAGAWMLTRQQEINSLIGRPTAHAGSGGRCPVDRQAGDAGGGRQAGGARGGAGRGARAASARRDAAGGDDAGHRNGRQQTDTRGRRHVPEGALPRGESQTAKRAPPPPGGRSRGG